MKSIEGAIHICQQLYISPTQTGRMTCPESFHSKDQSSKAESKSNQNDDDLKINTPPLNNKNNDKSPKGNQYIGVYD